MRTGRQMAEMPLDERRGLGLVKSPKKYKCEDRYSLSRDEMIDFLQRHDARTAERLRSVRRKGDPSVYDYIKEFDSWANASAAAFPNSSHKGTKSAPRSSAPIARKPRSRKGMRYRGRVCLDRAGLIAYMMSNKIRTARQLTKRRKKKGPNVYDYTKEFGSWKKAIGCVWGKDISTDHTPMYILQCICLYNAFSANAYREARRSYPAAVPSINAVIAEYGSWSTARQAARALAFEPAEKAYEDLWDKLGHSPTIRECKRHRVNIQVLIDLYGVKGWEGNVRFMRKNRAK